MKPLPPAGPPAAVDRRSAGVLIYGLLWVGGLLGLLVLGHEDPELRYHGARCLVVWVPCTVFMGLVNVTFGGVPLLGGLLILLLGGALVALWARTSYLAWMSEGGRFPIPLFSPAADLLAARLAKALG